MSEDNKETFLKSKKGKFAIFGVIMSVVMVFVITMIVSSINSAFGDPLAQQNAENIDFSMDLKQGEKEQQEQKDLDDYVNDIKRPSKIIDQKNLNFSINPKEEEGIAVNYNRENVIDNKSTQRKLNEILNPRSTYNAEGDGGGSTTKRESNRATPKTNEKEAIKNEIQAIYETGSSNKRQTSNNNQFSKVSGDLFNEQTSENSSLLEKRKRMMGNEENVATDRKSSDKLYSCVIHGTQKVKENNTVVLRLIDELVLSGSRIPKNTIFYGTLQRGGGNDRVKIIISSIKVGGSIYQLQSSIYSTDGIEGIRIANPEVLTKAKEETVNQTNSMIQGQLSGNSITQAVGSIASAVVSASSREKQLEVTLVENLKVYLKTQND